MEETPKIVELDDVSDDDYSDSGDEDAIHIKFKQDVLKNRSVFEKQLLEEGSMDFDPENFFDIKQNGQIYRDHKELSSKMDLEILEVDAENNEEENEENEPNRLKKLAEKMTPVEGCEGVYKKLSRPGEGGCPPENSIVTIHYNGYVQDEISGQIISFDSSVLRAKPQTFMRGKGDVILGLDLAVGSMKKKEQSEFVFTPEMAYGINGCPPRIPGNAYVYFKVDLLDWVDSCAAEAFSKLPAKTRKELPFAQVLEAAKSEKRKGNAQFAKNNYTAAERSYRHALGWITGHGYADEKDEELGQALCLELHLNLASTYLRLSRPKKTCIHCKEALDIDPKNPKAFYRLGKAQESLGDYSAAQRSLLRAQAIAPKDPSIARALLDLTTRIEKEKYIEKDLCARMLGTLSAKEKKDNTGISEVAAAIYREQFDTFVKSEDKVLVFAPGKTPEERKFLETEAKRMNLVFGVKPTLNGECICEIKKN